jgi:tetratricopeptide (TPR) repeat protein
MREAAQQCRMVLATEPDHLAARHLLGLALMAQGEFEAAVEQLAWAVAANSRASDLHFHLGIATAATGRNRDAIEPLRQAIVLDPQQVEAHATLAAVLVELGQAGEAVAAYRRAIALRPQDASLRLRLGSFLANLAPPTGALAELEKAIELAPDWAPAHLGLGILLTRVHQSERARQAFERAIRLDPEVPECYLNLGEVLRRQEQLESAIECFDEALRRNGNLRAARCSRGMARLQLGQFAQGWEDYEARIGLPNYDTLVLEQPQWDGTPTDRTVLVHAEGGLGDTLQYIRFVKQARRRATNLLVAVRTELISLLTSSGLGPLVSRAGPLPRFDLQVPLLSLPYVFGATLESVGCDVPYLSPEASLVSKWREKLLGHAGLKIGIHWQGNPRYWLDRFRSPPLAAFAPLAQVPSAVLISLQKNEGRDQLPLLAGKFPVVDLGAELDPGPDAFVDTAAVMKCLDLVVTSDTATAHLAGGMGLPVWVALGQRAEWRWLLNRGDSPWYPTMQLFRQQVEGDWASVFGRMAGQLRSQHASHDQ